MKIRIISGKFGGQIIEAPAGATTHPMSERVRGSLFNIIRPRLVDAEVLDAFAGSGVIGFESLSHLAKSVTFVERDRLAINSIEKNIQKLGVESTTDLFKGDITTWIRRNKDTAYDVIIIDPPYENMQLSTVEKISCLLKPKGLMVLSYPGKGEVPQINEFVVVDNRSYGNAALAFYQRK